MQIIHNVDDRRHGFVGSFEIEPLVFDQLGPEHVGRSVVYQDHGRAEAGTITSWRDGIVFARYSRGSTAAGASADRLSLVVRSTHHDQLAFCRASALPRAAPCSASAVS